MYIHSGRIGRHGFWKEELREPSELGLTHVRELSKARNTCSCPVWGLRVCHPPPRTQPPGWGELGLLESPAAKGDKLLLDLE